MIKLFVALALTALAGSAAAAPAAAASESVSQDECVARSAEYLSKAPVTEALKSLLHSDTWKTINEGLEAVASLGPQEGCDELLEYIDLIDSVVPCTNRYGNGEYFLSNISSSNEKAMLAYKASILCLVMDGEERKDSSVLVTA